MNDSLSNPDEKDKNLKTKQDLSLGAIIGIIIGSIVTLLAIILSIYYIFKYYNSKSLKKENIPKGPPYFMIRDPSFPTGISIVGFDDYYEYLKKNQ